MPDQWGRLQFNDWMGITNAINAYGSMQAQNKKISDERGVESGMGYISEQQALGKALGDIAKPEKISERQWAEALANKYNMASMDDRQKSATYNRWNQEFNRNKEEAKKAIAVLKAQKETSVPENQRKDALLDFYNKHVYDNQRYVGTETTEDGSVFHIFENSVTGQRIQQPDSTADEMLWAADDYLNRWFDQTAPSARSKRIEKNIQGLLNPIEMVNDSGDTIYLYEQIKRGSDGYEPIIVRKNPAKDANPQDPADFTETSVKEWVAKGYKPVQRISPEKQLEMQGKQAKGIRDSMDFIAKQLGVVPDKKKSSGDDLLAIALGSEQPSSQMPETSTLKGILGKIENGSKEEKALAVSWLQMAGDLYPGLKNIQGGEQEQKSKGKQPQGGEFSLNEDDQIEMIKSAQKRKIEAKRIQGEDNSKASRKIDQQLPNLKSVLQGYGGQTQQAMPQQTKPVLSMNEYRDVQNRGASRQIDAQNPNFGSNLNRYSQQPGTAVNMQKPAQSNAAPFQYNPDQMALNLLRANRPYRR